MRESERAGTALLCERSRRLRLRAESTRRKSYLLHGEAVRLLDAGRTTQIEKYAYSSRRRLAGGSGPVDDALSLFARDIARELTPPLLSLWLRIDVMLAEFSSGQPSTDIINDLFVLSRFAGQMAAIVKSLSCCQPGSSLDLGRVDLNAVLAEGLSPVIPRLARRGVAVRLNRGRDVPPILADTDALRYVVTSLVETVADTSATVDVTTRAGANGDVHLDVGTGRMPETLRPITALDASRLVLTDAVVRNFGGTVERYVGNPAATFTVSFRAADKPSAGVRSASAT